MEKVWLRVDPETVDSTLPDGPVNFQRVLHNPPTIFSSSRVSAKRLQFTLDFLD